MPTAARLPCLTPGCPELVDDGGRCARCRPSRHLERNIAGFKWYKRARWCHPTRGLRARVILAQPFCCVPGCDRLTEEVDHIVPHRGDPVIFWDPDNLQGLCRAHHAAKTRRGA
jgi:5-methylcytosine-specific restriction protein A